MHGYPLRLDARLEEEGFNRYSIECWVDSSCGDEFDTVWVVPFEDVHDGGIRLQRPPDYYSNAFVVGAPRGSFPPSRSHDEAAVVVAAAAVVAICR